MKPKVNLTGRFLGLASIACWLAVQFPAARLCSLREPSSPLELTSLASAHTAGMNLTSDRRSITKKDSSAIYAELPLSLEANYGQTDPQVKFLARGRGYNLYLTSNEVVMQLRALADPASSSPKQERIEAASNSSAVRMKLNGANADGQITGMDELPGKTNYFIGTDPTKWRTNIPSFSRVKYESVYPGVDVVFYGNQRQLEYDFVIAPGASFKSIRMEFDGARRIRLDDSGDLLIEASIGEIRQRKPVIYQKAGVNKQPVSGTYLIASEREVGFEVGDYDPNGSLVIDPVLVYSTSIGGSYNDSANAVAVDAEGNAYIAGITTSLDFMTANPFQQKLKIGTAIGIPSDAFVAKLNPSGNALLYSTYLGGGGPDAANGIAVDAAGNAYVTGYAVSNDFPTTPAAFQTTANTGGDAFVTKLNPTGNTLVYSTRLGGPPNSFNLGLPTSAGMGLAIDMESNAYIAGYTFSPSFPLKRAAQGEFNAGHQFGSQCLHFLVPISLSEDAFVTKLNSSGDNLVYSTYLGGEGQDEALAIAVDSAGGAYVVGRSCFPGFTPIGPGGAVDAFLIKLSPSGREFEYEIALGGTGDEMASGVAVDSAGNAYVTGQTSSSEFPTTTSALSRNLFGSVCYLTTNGGVNWQAAAGLPNSPLNALAIDPTNPQRIYAGFSNNGLFGSTDGGNTWRKIILPTAFVTAIAVDPKSPSTIYTDLFKSTDGGANWTIMRLPVPNLGCGTDRVVIDPSNTSTVYLLSPSSVCGDFGIPGALFKTTDGGNTWRTLRNAGNTFEANSLAMDPKNSYILYATSNSGDLFKSTDGGETWRVPYQGNRSFVLLSIDPIDTSTLYLRDTPDNRNNLFKSTDGGISFKTLSLAGIPIRALVVDPINSSVLYAATGYLGNGGGVFKSTDGGETWTATDLTGITVNTLAIDPQNSSRLYAGTYFDTDAFLAKLDPTGRALIYSTYLGTRSPDFGAAIGVDEVGNAYVTGKTFSDRFLTKDALQTTKPSGPFDTATFVMKLNAAGSQILFSTYLGTEASFGSAIAVGPAGRAYVVGTTGQFAIVPSARLPESVHGGYDAFVMEIASSPRITGASVIGKNLIVIGEGFDKGAVILVDGVEQRTRNDESAPTSILIGKKTATSIALGQKVSIQVRSSDGLISDTFSFTRFS